MKNLIAFLSLALCLIFVQNACGQNKSTSVQTESSNAVLKFASQEIAINNLPEKGLLTFKNNVSLKTDKVEFRNAAKVAYNGTTKTITVYGCRNFTIYDGKVVTQMKNNRNNIIKYTIGDDSIYLF